MSVGLAAFWDSWLLSKAEKEVIVRQFFTNLGDWKRLVDIIYGIGPRELGHEHPDVKAGMKLIDSMIEQSKPIIAEIDRAIAVLDARGEWPFDTKSVYAEMESDQTSIRSSGQLGVWQLVLVAGLLVDVLAIGIYAAKRKFDNDVIVAKARATAILREVEARAKAIEDGKGNTVPGTGPFDQKPGLLDGVEGVGVVLAVAAVAAAALIAFGGAKR